MESINIDFPVSWGEIDRRQLLIIGDVLSKKKTREEYLMFLFLRLAGLKSIRIKGTVDETDEGIYCFDYKGNSLLLSAEFIQIGAEKMSYIIDSVGLPKESPIDGVNVKLNDISFEAYYYADAFIGQYFNTKEINCIMKAVEVLSPNNKILIDMSFATSFLIWWAGLRDFFKNKYPNVFGEGESDSDKTPLDSMHEIVAFLSDNRPYLEKDILKSEAHSVLISLNNKLWEMNQYGKH